MAKELALIEARNNRNKKKKEQLDLQAPVKAITNTVKKVEPKQNTAKKTTTQKTTTQKATQRPQTNLLSNNNTRTMPTFESKDNRTVKTTNTNKSKNKASSIKTVDVYTKGGRFYYEDNGKEHEVDRNLLMNAWNNNRTGVVGQFDKKGKFQETDSRGVNKQDIANKNYKEKLDILNKAQKSLSKKSGEEYRKRGIDLSTQNNLRLNPQNQILNFSDRNEQMKSAQQRLTERAAKQQPLIEEANKQLKQEIQDVNKATNDYALAKYLKNYEDVENQEIGYKEKTFSPFITGIGEIVDNFGSDNKYVDENGNVTYLPSKATMQWNKIRNSYGNNFIGKLARFAGDVAHEGGKIATTALLNAPTAGIAGSALYFSDIAGDIYKQNINEGYGEDKAWTDALLKTGQSYIKQKIIGGLGGKLTGSGPSWLEKSLTNTWSKAVSNPVVSKTLASMSSEAIDEFTDEWIESAIDSAVLGKDFDPMQVFKDSLYSGAIGGATGAFGGMGDRVNTSLDENRLALQELNTIADQRIQQLQQEVQQDPSIAQEATQEIQDIQNYVQAQTNIIQNQAQTQAQESETPQPNAITQETQNMLNKAKEIDIKEPEYNSKLGPIAQKVDDTLQKIQSKTNSDEYISIRKNPTMQEVVEGKLKQRQEYLNNTLNRLSQKEGTRESTFNNEIEENKKAEETFRNIKTKEDMDNLISNLKDKVDNIKTGEDLKNTFKEIYDIYKVYNKSNDIYEVVEKDGLYGTRFESEFYNPGIKYKPLNEEIKIQKDNLESWLRTIKDNSEEIIYNNQDKVTPTIGKNIDSLDKVTPITTDDFKNKLHDYIDKETEDIKGKFESKDGHLFRGGREVKYLYRAIDQAEMDSIKNNGYIKSNQSKNIGYEIEQGLTDFKDNYPGFYLPRNADGYIIKIEVKPENGFFYDSDEYAKTPNEIPANQIVEINGEKINTQQETQNVSQNEKNEGTQESAFSLDKNSKRYDDLSKSNKVEYFRKGNGDVRVYMIDSNNNLVNEIDLKNQDDAVKELGEKLGNQIFNTATDNNQNIDLGNDINNLGTETDYFMTHRPTETSITADNLTNQDVESPMPKDMYEHPEYYFDMSKDYTKESMDVLRKIKNNPNAEITIYRATKGNNINKGDWVTLSKKYAEMHNNSQLDGKGNIIEMKVKPTDIQFAGDEINEWGYFPKENTNIPSKAEQSVINEGEKTSGVFSTVAPYYSTQVNDRNYNKVKENVDSQFTNKALNIASNLGVNVEGIQNNVGGYSFDDGKGRVDELSYTYKLKDGTSNEDAKMFGCLLGDLGHETQESVVVGNYTNSNNGNANLEYTLKLNDGSGIIKALKEAGITDYTFNKQTNELQLLLFKDDNGNFNEQKILDQFQKLNQVLGGKISEPTKNYVESELIESEDRQNLYGEWLESNRGTKNRELYSQIEEAYKKVKEFNDKKPKEEQSSFSNENIQSENENVITIKNDNLKDVPKSQIKGEDTGVSINGKQVQLEIPVNSKPNKLGQYVPKDGFTQKELKNGKLGDSQFYKNVTERADFIKDRVRQDVKDDNYVKHYRKITNDESMQEAFDDLNTRGTEAIADFFNNDKELTSKDTAMGWLLIEQSQANGDYEFTNQVLRKMRSNATKTAQTLQMYNYYARLTPEGMYKWCGDQLARAEEIFEKNKTKKWIDANKNRWQLTPDETDFIKKQMNRVQELNNMNDSDTTTIEMKKGKTKEVTVERAKQVEIAKVQAMIENKIPPAKGQALNAWMRISMLGNLKTMGTRNPLGNIALRPINDVGDIFASAADFAISKVTGVRTKGTFNAKAQAKGFKKGASEAVQDVSLGINTRDAKGNRFEIGEGKSFNEKHTGAAKVLNPFSKAGNKLDTGVSFLLDLGDRPFYEATYQQSLENQMKLNGITNPENVTDSMKKIAEQEALERTYQDDNNYTKSVIAIRDAMNNFNIKGYGLGDVLIPFAKTPANLTKAIVDYSPAGFVNAITKGKNLKNSIQNGQFTPEMQHAFVNQLGKATAGTLLYAAGAALAQSGLITGGSDEDKDVADFMRNTLGIQPYSIKIGNKSFTYDWAQPVASGLAIPADIKKGIEDAKEGEVDLEYIVHKAFSTGGTVLLEQSFLQGIKDVLGGYGDPLDNLMSEIEGLPARAIPTLFQQITTYLDGTKRMPYGNKGMGNVLSQAKAKTIFGKDLPVYRNSMGKEIKMYGGKNNFFNVFLNPANYSEGNATESAEEIYAIYEATNNKDILPKLVSSNLKNEDGSKLTNQQKSDFLKVSGDIIDDNVKELKNNNYYKNMSDEDKAETIKAIVDYAYNIAREEITGHKLSSSYKKAKNATTDGGYAIADYYAKQKQQSKNNKKTTSDRNRYKELADKGIDGATFDDFKAFVKTAKGESRTGGLTKKQKIINYINQLPLSKKEKEALYNDYLENQGYFSYYN